MDYRLIRLKIRSKKCFCWGCKYFNVKKDSEMPFAFLQSESKNLTNFG